MTHAEAKSLVGHAVLWLSEWGGWTGVVLVSVDGDSAVVVTREGVEIRTEIYDLRVIG